MTDEEKELEYAEIISAFQRWYREVGVEYTESSRISLKDAFLSGTQWNKLNSDLQKLMNE